MAFVCGRAENIGRRILYHEKGVSYVVFNIGGNKFRLTATIQYARKSIQGVVVISRIETHPEYDRR